MNVLRNSAITLFAALICSSASAQYRCVEPPTDLDRRACEAAQQGPEALRRFIQRVRMVESLHFDDYVNKATLLAWEEKAAREQAAEQAAKPGPVATRTSR
jgi:hypothetical protein